MKRTLGSGGFGNVYLAYDAQANRLCAIKEIKIDTSDRIDAVVNEVMILQRCSQFSFIPRIYDWSFEDRGPYYKVAYVVMEYIDGKPLNHVTEWSPQSVAAFLHTMLHHLAQLHDEGFVHRDIKPANIILTHHTTYVLVDFGIAKAGAATRSVVRPIATPDFASPEQLYGLSTDARSDLYSLGATAYFLLTRKQISPLAQRHRTSVLEQLRKSRSDIPPALASTLNAMLQYDPDDRPAHARAALDLLDAPVRRVRRTVAGTLLLVLLIALLTFSLLNRDALAHAMTRVGEQIGIVGAEPDRPSFPQQAFEATLNAAGGTFAAVVYDVTYDRMIYVKNENKDFTAASLAKLPIAITAYQLAHAEQINLDDSITVEDQDRAGGTGSIQHAPTGSSFTIRELCRRMLSESDNTAGNMVLRVVGMDAVDRIMDQIGANDTRVERRFGPQFLNGGSDNRTTAADMLEVLQTLTKDGVLPASSREEILAAMRDTDRNKIAAGLPPNVGIAHKTGVLEGVEHDAAIITLPDQRYIIVLLSADLPSQADGQAAIAQASRIVFEWFGE